MSNDEESKVEHECCINIKLISGKNIFQSTEGKLQAYVVFRVGDFKTMSFSVDNKTTDPEWIQTMNLFFLRKTEDLDLLVELYQYDESDKSSTKPEEIGVRVIRHLERKLVTGYEITYSNYKLSNNSILSFSLFSKDIGFSRESIGISAVSTGIKPEEIPAVPMISQRKSKRKTIFSLFKKKKSSSSVSDWEDPDTREVKVEDPQQKKSGAISLAGRVVKGLKSSLRFLQIDDMSSAQLVNFATGDVSEDMFLTEVWKSYRIKYEELKIDGMTSHNRQVFYGSWKDKKIMFKPYQGVRLKKKKDMQRHKLFSRQFRGFVKISQFKNVVRFYGIVVKARRIGVVLEHCYYGDLKSFLKTNPHYNLRDRYKIIFDIICGMRYIHSKNFVHRNLCPENVMVDENGVAKITNFEKARIKDVGGVQQTAAVGKERYMALECYEGRYSDKSDVYSLGIMILEILSNNFEMKWNKNSSKSILELKEVGILTEWLYRIVLSILRDNPNQRPGFFDLQRIFMINLSNCRIPDHPLDLFMIELSQFSKSLIIGGQSLEKNEIDNLFEEAIEFTLNPSECTITNLREMIKRGNCGGQFIGKEIDKIWQMKISELTKQKGGRSFDKMNEVFKNAVEIKSNEDVFLLENDCLLVYSWSDLHNDDVVYSKNKEEEEDINDKKKEEEIEEIEGEGEDDENDDNIESSVDEEMKNENVEKRVCVYLKLPDQEDCDADDDLVESNKLNDLIKIVYDHFPREISHKKDNPNIRKQIKRIFNKTTNSEITHDNHVRLIKQDNMLVIYFEEEDEDSEKKTKIDYNNDKNEIITASISDEIDGIEGIDPKNEEQVMELQKVISRLKNQIQNMEKKEMKKEPDENINQSVINQNQEKNKQFKNQVKHDNIEKVEEIYKNSDSNEDDKLIERRKKYVQHLQRYKNIQEAYESAEEEFIKDRLFILEILRKDALSLEMIISQNELYGKDREITLFAVRHNGLALQFVDSEFKSDEEVVMEAVKNNGNALQFASLTLRNDEKIVECALNIMMDDDDEENSQEDVENHRIECFRYIGDELMKKRVFLRKLISSNIFLLSEFNKRSLKTIIETLDDPKPIEMLILESLSMNSDEVFGTLRGSDLQKHIFQLLCLRSEYLLKMKRYEECFETYILLYEFQFMQQRSSDEEKIELRPGFIRLVDHLLSSLFRQVCNERIEDTRKIITSHRYFRIGVLKSNQIEEYCEYLKATVLPIVEEYLEREDIRIRERITKFEDDLDRFVLVRLKRYDEILFLYRNGKQKFLSALRNKLKVNKHKISRKKKDDDDEDNDMCLFSLSLVDPITNLKWGYSLDFEYRKKSGGRFTRKKSKEEGYYLVFFGKYEHGVKEGEGIEYDANFATSISTSDDNNIVGFGNQPKFHGMFLNDQRHGKGRVLGKVKAFDHFIEVYEGMFQDGKRHGKSQFYDVETEEYLRGVWNNGKLEKIITKYSCKFWDFAELNKKTQGLRKPIGRGAYGDIFSIPTSCVSNYNIFEQLMTSSNGEVDEEEEKKRKKRKKPEYLAVKVFGKSILKEERTRMGLMRDIRRSMDCLARLKDKQYFTEIYGICIGKEGNTNRVSDVAYIMELANTSIDKLISAEIKLDFAEKMRILWETALGMNSLHDISVMHRDLKWSNILYLDGHIKITDFETIKEEESSWRWEVENTTSGRGTMFFNAPERGNKDYGLAVDVYAFGMMCYCLLFDTNNPYRYQKDCQVCQRTISSMDPLQLSSCVRYHNLRPLLNDEYVKKIPLKYFYILRILSLCWEAEPLTRPTFQQIVELFSRAKEEEKKEVSNCFFWIVTASILVLDQKGLLVSEDKSKRRKKKNKKKKERQVKVLLMEKSLKVLKSSICKIIKEPVVVKSIEYEELGTIETDEDFIRIFREENMLSLDTPKITVKCTLVTSTEEEERENMEKREKHENKEEEEVEGENDEEEEKEENGVQIEEMDEEWMIVNTSPKEFERRNLKLERRNIFLERKNLHLEKRILELERKNLEGDRRNFELEKKYTQLEQEMKEIRLKSSKTKTLEKQ